MNTRLQDLIADLQLVFSDQPWYGDGVLQKLSTINATEAAYIPDHTGRSICQIVRHMIAWRRFAIERANNNPDFRIEVGGPQDWPVAAGAEDWSRTMDQLGQSQTELLEILRSKDDAWLSSRVPGSKFNFGFLMRGVVQHDVYHLGQIGLVLRMVREQL